MAAPGAGIPLYEAANMPATPPVTRLKSKLPTTPRVGTPARGKAPVPASPVPATPQPAKTPATIKRIRSRSVPPRPVFEAELATWDKKKLITSLMEREEAAANLELDVSAWEERWRLLQSDGEALQQEYLAQSLRAKRYAEMVAGLRIEVDALKEKEKMIEKEREEDVMKEKSEKSALESSLLSHNLALQKQLTEAETSAETAQAAVSSLVAEMAAIQNELAQQRASSELASALSSIPSSPQRQLEAQTIRVETLRGHVSALEARLKDEALVRSSLERDLRQTKQQFKEAKEAEERERLEKERKEKDWAKRLEGAEAAGIKERALLLERLQRAQAESSAAESEVQSVRVAELELEVARARKEVDEHKSAKSQLEEDLRLLYSRQRAELKAVDGKYQHKARSMSL